MGSATSHLGPTSAADKDRSFARSTRIATAPVLDAPASEPHRLDVDYSFGAVPLHGERPLRGLAQDVSAEPFAPPADDTGSAANAVTLQVGDNGPPQWLPHGAFEWHVRFWTTGRSGWIVQSISNTWNAEDAAGAAVAMPFTPKFWEAWSVDAAGQVQPTTNAIDHDVWENGDLTAEYGAVKGRWATAAKLYFTTTDPATQGFVVQNPATDAAFVPSSTTEPSGLGRPLVTRYADGKWNAKRHNGRTA